MHVAIRQRRMRLEKQEQRGRTQSAQVARIRTPGIVDADRQHRKIVARVIAGQRFDLRDEFVGQSCGCGLLAAINSIAPLFLQLFALRDCALR